MEIGNTLANECDCFVTLRTPPNWRCYAVVGSSGSRDALTLSTESVQHGGRRQPFGANKVIADVDIVRRNTAVWRVLGRRRSCTYEWISQV